MKFVICICWTVGDLPINIQKTVASSYTFSQLQIVESANNERDSILIDSPLNDCSELG